MNGITGSIMGSDSGIATKRFNHICDDNILDHVSLPILTQDLLLCPPLATSAKFLWLRFWHRMVGNFSQHDRLFCRLTCNIVSNF